VEGIQLDALLGLIVVVVQMDVMKRLGLARRVVARQMASRVLLQISAVVEIV
jgi:hypothetical protein